MEKIKDLLPTSSMSFDIVFAESTASSAWAYRMLINNVNGGRASTSVLEKSLWAMAWLEGCVS